MCKKCLKNVCILTFKYGFVGNCNEMQAKYVGWCKSFVLLPLRNGEW